MLIALPFESLVGLLVSAWIPVPILLLIQQPQHIYFQNAILWNKGYHLSCMRFVVTLTYKYSAYFILLCMCVCIYIYIYIYFNGPPVPLALGLLVIVISDHWYTVFIWQEGFLLTPILLLADEISLTLGQPKHEPTSL